MSRARLPRKLVLALLGALIALCTTAFPRVASAAPADQACDRDAFASMIPLAELAAMLQANALADTDLAGFCDSRGATAIAPLPARPLDGSVLYEGDSQASWTHDSTNADSRRDTPSRRGSDIGANAFALPPLPFVLPSYAPAEVLSSESQRRELPDGFARGLDHPPRLS